MCRYYSWNAILPFNEINKKKISSTFLSLPWHTISNQVLCILSPCLKLRRPPSHPYSSLPYLVSTALQYLKTTPWYIFTTGIRTTHDAINTSMVSHSCTSKPVPQYPQSPTIYPQAIFQPDCPPCPLHISTLLLTLLCFSFFIAGRDNKGHVGGSVG